MVIPGKGCEGVIGHKQRRSDQHNSEISFSKMDQSLIGTKEPKKFSRKKNSCENKRNAADQAPKNRLCEIKIRISALGFADGISGSRADADHGADCINQPVNRQDQVQHRQSICT